MSDVNEIEIQHALGTLDRRKYMNNLAKNAKERKCRNCRHCHLCGNKIVKGETYYFLSSRPNGLTSSKTFSPETYINICIDCTWLSLPSMVKRSKES